MPSGVAVTCVDVSESNRSNTPIWAAGTSQNKVLIGSFDNLTIREIDLGKNQPMAVEFSQNGDKILIAGRNGHLSIHALADLREEKNFSSEFTKAVYEACWSADGSKIAAVSWELTGEEVPVLGFVKVIDAGTGKCIHKIGLDGHPASSVQIAQKMDRIYTGTWGCKPTTVIPQKSI